MTSTEVRSRRARTVGGLLAALDGAGIRYCVLRNYVSLAAEPGRDVDIVVERNALEGVATTVASLAEREAWACAVRCRDHHEGMSFYFLSPPSCSSHRVEQLEIHCTRVRWSRLTILGTTEILDARRRGADGLWLAAPEHEFAQRLLQHALAGSLGKLKPHHRQELSEFARAEPVLATEVLSAKVGAVAARKLAGIAQAGCLDVPRSTGRVRAGFMRATFDGPTDALRALGAAGERSLTPLRRAACGVAAFVGPTASREGIDSFVELVSPMFLTTTVVSQGQLEADGPALARKTRAAGLIVARSPRPAAFSGRHRWRDVGVEVDPGNDRAGTEVLARFVANHDVVYDRGRWQ